MHTLAREVRFSINPFADNQCDGFNSYACKPTGHEGLCIYLSLWVELSGQLNPDTGFVVNVTEIDKAARKSVVPLIVNSVSSDYREGRIPLLSSLGQMLRQCKSVFDSEFSGLQVTQLTLNINPYRSISIQSEDYKMLYYSEKFEFSAMHQLWNDQFSDAENDKMFGKCANPAGHGHNYILEVKVEHSGDSTSPDWILQYQRVIKESFLDIVDHKNLNVDVPGFEAVNPTVENLARFAWEKLAETLNHCKLCSVTIWENDRTYCVYTSD